MTLTWLSVGPTDVLHARLVLGAWNLANAKLYYPPDVSPVWSQADGIVLHAFSQWWNAPGKLPIAPLGTFKNGILQAELTDAHLVALDKWAAENMTQVTPPVLDIPASKALLVLWSKTSGSGKGLTDYGLKPEDIGVAWTSRDATELKAFSGWWNENGNSPTLGATGILATEHSVALKTWAAKQAAKVPAGWTSPPNTPPATPAEPPPVGPLPTPPKPGTLATTEPAGTPWWLWVGGAVVLGAGIWTLSKVLSPAGGSPLPPSANPTRVRWDPNTGIRERLFLLSQVDGDLSRVPLYQYNVKSDSWYTRELRPGWPRVLPVNTEGSASLAKLAKDGISRREAMEMIGFPEKSAANPLTTAQDRRAWQALGTVAHNRPFTIRELSEYVGFNARSFVKRLERVGMLQVVEVAPVRYYPTPQGWERIEAEVRPSANPLPSKNIFWRDIKPEDRVALVGHTYVVTKPNGKRLLAYWSGQDAREAQRWLDAKVSQDALRARGKLQDNPKGSRRIGTFGDVNPVDYGGGVIYRNEYGTRVEYTHGLDGGDTPEKMTVYSVDVPDDVFAEYTWAKPEDVASSIGTSGAQLIASGMSRSLQERVGVIEEIAGYYGWHELDDYPLTMTEKELRRRWRMH